MATISICSYERTRKGGVHFHVEIVVSVVQLGSAWGWNIFTLNILPSIFFVLACVSGVIYPTSLYCPKSGPIMKTKLSKMIKFRFCKMLPQFVFSLMPRIFFRMRVVVSWPFVLVLLSGLAFSCLLALILSFFLASCLHPLLVSLSCHCHLYFVWVSRLV